MSTITVKIKPTTLHNKLHMPSLQSFIMTLKSQPISRTVVMHLIGDLPCGWGLVVEAGFKMLININPLIFVAPDVVSLFAGI